MLTFVSFVESILVEDVEVGYFLDDMLHFLVDGIWDVASCQKLDNPVIELWVHSVVWDEWSLLGEAFYKIRDMVRFPMRGTR